MKDILLQPYFRGVWIVDASAAPSSRAGDV